MAKGSSGEVKVNLPKSVQKDISKVKMDQAVQKLKERVKRVKQLEKDSGKPLSSEKLLGYMADIEKEFLATKIYNQLQSILKEIEEKLSAYDAPINTLKKQMAIMIQNHEEFIITVTVSTKAVKISAWVIGTLVTLFTLINIMAGVGG